MGVVDTIATVETIKPGDRPIEKIVMNTVKIIRIGSEAEDFNAIDIMTNYFKEEEEIIAKAEESRKAFIIDIAKQRDLAQEQSSGLKIFPLRQGEGEKPNAQQRVLVNYTGWLDDGKPTLFTTTEKALAEGDENFSTIVQRQSGKFLPAPMPFSPDSNLTAGFKEGLLSMKVGDKLRLFIPPHLGWGAQGAGGVIPPNASIIFDIEVLEIMK